MGRVKELWQAERDRRWQQHFDNYCVDNFGGRDPTGRELDEAEQHANEQMEEEDEGNDGDDPHPIAGVCSFSKHEL